MAHCLAHSGREGCADDPFSGEGLHRVARHSWVAGCFDTWDRSSGSKMVVLWCRSVYRLCVVSNRLAEPIRKDPWVCAAISARRWSDSGLPADTLDCLGSTAPPRNNRTIPVRARPHSVTPDSLTEPTLTRSIEKESAVAVSESTKYGCMVSQYAMQSLVFPVRTGVCIHRI